VGLDTGSAPAFMYGSASGGAIWRPPGAAGGRVAVRPCRLNLRRSIARPVVIVDEAEHDQRFLDALLGDPGEKCGQASARLQARLQRKFPALDGLDAQLERGRINGALRVRPDTLALGRS
jgi:hypothetical protein